MYLQKYKSSAPPPPQPPRRPARRDDSIDFDEDEIDVSLSSEEDRGASSRGNSRNKKESKGGRVNPVAKTRRNSRGQRGSEDNLQGKDWQDTRGQVDDGAVVSGAGTLMSLRELDETGEEGMGWSLGKTLKEKLSSSAVGVIKSATDITGIGSWVSKSMEEGDKPDAADIINSPDNKQSPIEPESTPTTKRFLTIADLSSIVADGAPDSVIMEDRTIQDNNMVSG